MDAGEAGTLWIYLCNHYKNSYQNRAVFFRSGNWKKRRIYNILFWQGTLVLLTDVINFYIATYKSQWHSGKVVYTLDAWGTDNYDM